MAVIAYQVRNMKILAQYRGTHRKERKTTQLNPTPVIKTNKVHCQSIKVNDIELCLFIRFFLSHPPSDTRTILFFFYFGFLHVVVIEKRTLGQYIYIYTVRCDGLTEKLFT